MPFYVEVFVSRKRLGVLIEAAVAVITVLVAAIVFVFLLTGCEVHTYHEPYPPKKVYYTETVVTHTPVVYETYACYDPTYEPYYHSPEWCTEYGLGVGYCCTWTTYDSYGYSCEEEWCWWDDICDWDFMGESCYY